jgi:hypothetical protein
MALGSGHKFEIPRDPGSRDPGGDAPSETLCLSRQETDTICSRSIELKDLIVNDRATGCTTLQLDESADIDHDSLSSLITNLHRPVLETTGLISVLDLSRLCNALWRYKCNPDTFKGLASELKDSWNIKQGEREEIVKCWRLPIKDTDCNESVYKSNIAWVLGFDNILREELKIAIWKSTADLRTSVKLLQNLISEHDH